MDKPSEDNQLSTPPYFKSWRSIYIMVLGNLMLMIVLLYFFSTSFV